MFQMADWGVSWLCVGLFELPSCVVAVLGAECSKSVQNAVETVSAVLALSGLSMLSRLGATGFCPLQEVVSGFLRTGMILSSCFLFFGERGVMSCIFRLIF